jgi:hypothetical protein
MPLHYAKTTSPTTNQNNMTSVKMDSSENAIGRGPTMEESILQDQIPRGRIREEAAETSQNLL